MDNSTQGFKKVLGRWDSIAINIAIVIGVGIFRVPSEVAKYLGSSNLIILAWFTGGVISLLGALCYAELSSSFPKTGGSYIYLRESYGSLTGFLFGWVNLLVVSTGSIAAVSFIFAEYLQSFLSIDNALLKPIAVFSILLLAFINIIGLRYGKKIQNMSAVMKILLLVGIIIFGFVFRKGDISHFHPLPMEPTKGGFFPLFGLALIPILWTYGGWHENTFVAEETKDARRTLPFALITGISVIILLYLVINALFIYLISPAKMANVGLIAPEALRILFGKSGKKLFEALVIISSLGCLNAMIITGSRVTYAMSKDNAFFRYIGKIKAECGTPYRAIIIIAVWAAVLVILGTFNKLLFFTGALVWLFFALTAAGLFILRRKFPDIERPYRIWGYPFTPAIFMLVCVALFVNTILHYAFQSVVGLCIAIAGIPLYVISQKKR